MMSEFKGVKGLWECVDMDDDLISEISATMITCGDLVLAVVGPTPDSSLPEDEHNAKLMAAAPDLLEVAQRYEKFFEAMFTTCCSNPVYNTWGKQVDLTLLNEAHYLAGAAIAKALGETK